MAKKSKRQVSKQSEVKTSGPTARPAPTRARASITTEFNPDYSAIISDLKRIGILAGSFFVILIVLSFFLR
ncbi:MAG: hypothetical protein BGO78_08660 [Chloroflexi bacterium 44-23]|nr:MAG: hypothetical protein BGO78_08660 [Chloroflexi bacterium 44-23]